MMRSILFALIFFVAYPTQAQKRDMGSFLKTCAWGTAIGAGVGAASLVLEDEPGKHTNNIARGASLGLYVGIAMGLLAMNEPEASRADEVWGVFPQFHEGKMEGAVVAAPLIRF